MGLVCVSYGAINNEPEKVKLQVQEGIDAVIVDSVLAIRKGLTGGVAGSGGSVAGSEGSVGSGDGVGVRGVSNRGTNENTDGESKLQVPSNTKGVAALST